MVDIKIFPGERPTIVRFTLNSSTRINEFRGFLSQFSTNFHAILHTILHTFLHTIFYSCRVLVSMSKVRPFDM